MHIFINLTSNLYCLAPLFLIVCPLSISSSFVLFPIYSLKTGLCLLQYSQLSRGCDSPRLLYPVPSGRRNWEIDRIGVSNSVGRSSVDEL